MRSERDLWCLWKGNSRPRRWWGERARGSRRRRTRRRGGGTCRSDRSGEPETVYCGGEEWSESRWRRDRRRRRWTMKVNGRHVDWGTCPLLLLIACTEPFILALYCTDSKRERKSARDFVKLSLSFTWLGKEWVWRKWYIDICRSFVFSIGNGVYCFLFSVFCFLKAKYKNYELILKKRERAAMVERRFWRSCLVFVFHPWNYGSNHSRQVDQPSIITNLPFYPTLTRILGITNLI